MRRGGEEAELRSILERLRSSTRKWEAQLVKVRGMKQTLQVPRPCFLQQLLYSSGKEAVPMLSQLSPVLTPHLGLAIHNNRHLHVMWKLDQAAAGVQYRCSGCSQCSRRRPMC